MPAIGRLATLFVAVLLAVSVVGATPAVVSDLGGSSAGTAPGVASAAHGAEGNYTVRPYDDGESSLAQDSQRHDTCRSNSETPSDDVGNEGASQDCDPYNGHMPGDTGASYLQFAYGGEAASGTLDPFLYVVHGDTSGQYDMRQCEVPNAAFAGIDRGNDDPGRSYETDLTEYFETTYELRHRITVDLTDGQLRAATHIAEEDQIVAGVEDCYTNPSEAGWYQWAGHVNGTESDGSRGRVELSSHYFPVCECPDRQAAIEMMGPPPSTDGGSSTPTPTATPTQGSTATPTPTATASPTPTSGGGGPTATPTSGGGGPTATPTSGDGGSTATPTQGGDGATATATPTSGGGNGGTPTVGSGPGFGVVVAVVALLAAALVTLRRRR